MFRLPAQVPWHSRCAFRHQVPVTVTLRGHYQETSASFTANGGSVASYRMSARARVLSHQGKMADDTRVALGLVIVATTVGLFVGWLHSSTQLPPPWNHVSDVLGFTYTAAWSGECLHSNKG